MNVKILRNVLEANDQIASRIREQLTARHITAINLISSPGAGKTSLLERTIPLLQDRYRIAVLEGDIATTRDADRIGKLGVSSPDFLVPCSLGLSVNPIVIFSPLCPVYAKFLAFQVGL